MRFYQIISILALSGLVLFACKDKKDDRTPFDKESLLINLADNIIIPALNQFQSDMSQLEVDYLTFQADRSQQNLDNVRDQWITAYKRWQSVKMFDFGPIRNYAFKASTGTFPTDTTKILGNITAGSYDIGNVANVDAIGLPSLDFLLYRIDALNYFIGDEGYTTYGLDVIQKIKTETDLMVSAWSSYRATFIASTGTETTSAFSEFVNEFNRDYELAKNAKLGIPFGKQSLGIQLPEYLEARYSRISLELLEESIRYLTRVYTGTSYNGTNDGVGFDDYLIHLDRGELNFTIKNNFNTIIPTIQGFDGTLEEEMSTNTPGLDVLYNQMQGQVVSLKTDMTSAFGILITYQDNDGD